MLKLESVTVGIIIAIYPSFLPFFFPDLASITDYCTVSSDDLRYLGFGIFPLIEYPVPKTKNEDAEISWTTLTSHHCTLLFFHFCHPPKHHSAHSLPHPSGARDSSVSPGVRNIPINSHLRYTR